MRGLFHSLWAVAMMNRHVPIPRTVKFSPVFPSQSRYACHENMRLAETIALPAMPRIQSARREKRLLEATMAVRQPNEIPSMPPR